MPITKLPTDMMIEIAMKMSKDDIIRLCLTNKTFKDLCKRPSLWKALVFRDFKHVKEEDKPSNVSWRNFYWYWVDSSSLQNIDDQLFNKINTILQNRAIQKRNQPLDEYLLMSVYFEDGHINFTKAHSIEAFLLTINPNKRKEMISNLPPLNEKFVPIGDIVDHLIDTLTHPSEDDEEWIEVHSAPNY
jgi:hypothetical protein